MKDKLTSFLRRRYRLCAGLVVVVGVLVFMGGLWRLFSYTLPMMKGSYDQAIQSSTGDTSLPYYNAGLALYKQEEYKAALEYLTRGYGLLNDENAQVSAEHSRTAAEFQLLIGNCFFYQRKLKEAEEAYKQALRHDPDYFAAKYNLELLAQPSMSGGGGSGPGPGKPKDPGGQSGKGGKQGI